MEWWMLKKIVEIHYSKTLFILFLDLLIKWVKYFDEERFYCITKQRSDAESCLVDWSLMSSIVYLVDIGALWQII